ncbi:MAG: HD domain-containing protein [Patescibacteria group bacterium]
MLKRITDFLFETFHLKNIKHEGWRFCGIPNPDSVAEHSLNAAQIGYVLAKME